MRRSVVPLLLVLGVGAVLLLGRGRSIPERDFDPAVWHSADERQRGAMVNHLRRSGRLQGKSRVAVTQLLGPPTDEAPDLISYRIDLGHDFGSAPWYYSLKIRSNPKTGTVTSVALLD